MAARIGAVNTRSRLLAAQQDGRVDAAPPDVEAHARERVAVLLPHQQDVAHARSLEAQVEAQKERFGGMKFGACFFGWLTAAGTGVLLTALLTGAGTAVGLGQGVDVADAAANPQGVGLVGGIVLLRWQVCHCTLLGWSVRTP